MKTGYKTDLILCLPICNYEGEVIGVAQIINKTDGSKEFTQHDVEVCVSRNNPGRAARNLQHTHRACWKQRDIGEKEKLRLSAGSCCLVLVLSI